MSYDPPSEPHASAPRIALTISGSDPSGGAGLQADLKTFHQHGVYGQAVVATLTVQDTAAVRESFPVEASLVGAQIDALLADRPPAAAKTGALGSAAVVRAVAASLAGLSAPIVVDPVLVATSGAPLLEAEAVDVLLERLLPRSTLVTPNAEEAARLTGLPAATVDEAAEACRALVALGPEAALVTGVVEGSRIADVLVADGEVRVFRSERLEVESHGTGCTLSAAITALLARGEDLASAVEAARIYVHRAIVERPGIGRALGFHAEPARPGLVGAPPEETP